MLGVATTSYTCTPDHLLEVCLLCFAIQAQSISAYIWVPAIALPVLCLPQQAEKPYASFILANVTQLTISVLVCGSAIPSGT